MKENSLSNNTIERMCGIYGFLNALEKKGIEFVSSKELAEAVATTDYSVRKDISSLDATGYTRKGYNVVSLKKALGEKLNIAEKRKACVVGLGRLGTALLDYERFQDDGFEIVAAFDNNINKLERIKTHVSVYSVGDMTRIIRDKEIDLGIITVPATAAQKVADTLIEGGVRGIMNFSPERVVVPKDIVYMSMDFTSALRFIAARF